VICPQCQATNEQISTLCGNCGNPLAEQVPLTLKSAGLPPDPFPSAAVQASPEATTPEMPGLFFSPGTPDGDGGQFGTPDSLYIAPDAADIPGIDSGGFGGFTGFGDQADQCLPSSSASQYPRTPGEQYLPDNRAGQYIPAGRVPAGKFRPDARRLSRVEQMAGGAALIVLISLFLPWFGFDVVGTTISVSGTSAHGYLAAAVLLAVLLAGYLLGRSSWEEFPVSLPVTHEVLLLAATGMQFILVAIGFVDIPVAGLSREFGAYLALIASVAAVGLAVTPAIRSWQARR